ncbi:MAG: hypothetical protein JJU19_06355 [Pararhodobacter sp.]|nr:hypothetical protein [Pararhodobacter sp.]
MSCHTSEPLYALIWSLGSQCRPRLLLQTARIGQADYRREHDLRRVLRLPAAPPPGPATIKVLMDLEAEQEQRRKNRFQAAGEPWRPSRHVELLIALMAEMRLLAVAAPAQPVPFARARGQMAG